MMPLPREGYIYTAAVNNGDTPRFLVYVLHSHVVCPRPAGQPSGFYAPRLALRRGGKYQRRCFYG